MMEKRNVIDGMAKTAEADNEEDVVGRAAKCIAAAEEAEKTADETYKEIAKTAFAGK